MTTAVTESGSGLSRSSERAVKLRLTVVSVFWTNTEVRQDVQSA
jgi:hypothetical protein